MASPSSDAMPANAAETSSNKDLTSTVAKHYNELREGGLEDRAKSRIFYMRNFNNWIKSVLINEYMTKLKKERESGGLLTVLDLCAGKGGDLLKWKKAAIDRLVCADIAGTSVKQSEERFSEMVTRSQNERFYSKLFSAEFLTADCTKLRLKDMYKDPGMTFDLVSCQFSFHYCFESLAQVEMMIRNACECLKPGGYFIGTTPNSYELVKRARNSADGRSFGNEVYSVTFVEENTDKLPLFGAKYDFHLEGVVDCPEFLVFFPAFEKLAALYGMKLVYRKPFAEFFQEQVARPDSRALLGKMQALEPFPSDNDVKLMSECADAYTSAQAHMDKVKADQQGDRPRVPKIGTLSQDEWEAVTVYTVFAFQKVGPSTAQEPPISSSTDASTESSSQPINQTTASTSSDQSESRSPESRKRTHGSESEEEGPPLEKVSKD